MICSFFLFDRNQNHFIDRVKCIQKTLSKCNYKRLGQFLLLVLIIFLHVLISKQWGFGDGSFKMPDERNRNITYDHNKKGGRKKKLLKKGKNARYFLKITFILKWEYNVWVTCIVLLWSWNLPMDFFGVWSTKKRYTSIQPCWSCGSGIFLGILILCKLKLLQVYNPMVK